MDLAQILLQGRLIRHLEDVRQMVSLRGLDALKASGGWKSPPN